MASRWGRQPRYLRGSGKTATALYLSLFAVAIGTVPATSRCPRLPPRRQIQSESAFGALPGRWVRPDGGYVINIKSVDASGKLDAAYANPNPLPFARAEAGHGMARPSSFSSRFVPAATTDRPTPLPTTRRADVLKGVYYQAVAQQKFDVFFTRVQGE